MARDWPDLQDQTAGQALPGTLAGTYNYTGILNVTGAIQQDGNAMTLGAAFEVGAKAVTITEAGGTGTLLVGTESFLLTTP